MSTDIFGSFRPFSLILKAIGVFPFNFDPKSRTFTSNLRTKLVSGALLTLFITVQFVLISRCRVLSAPTAVFEKLVFQDLSAVYATFLIYCNWKSAEIVKLLHRIDRFDRKVRFRKNGDPSLRKYLILNLAFFLAFFSSDLVVYFSGNSTFAVACTLGYYVANFLYFFVRILFVFFVFELKSRCQNFGSTAQNLARLNGICKEAFTLFHLSVARGVAKCFVLLTIQLGFLFLVWQGRPLWTAICLLWIVLLVCDMILTIYPVEDLYAQMRAVYDRSDQRDLGVKLHRLLNPAKFLIFGVFPLDYTVLLTVGTGTVTYVVYLVQFDIFKK